MSFPLGSFSNGVKIHSCFHLLAMLDWLGLFAETAHKSSANHFGSDTLITNERKRKTLKVQRYIKQFYQAMSAKTNSESAAAAQQDVPEREAESTSPIAENEDGAVVEENVHAAAELTMSENENTVTETETNHEELVAEEATEFSVHDKRRFTTEMDLAAENFADGDTADNDSDAYEIDLDQLHFDSGEAERELSELRLKLKATEEKLRTSEAQHQEASKTVDEYADRFRKAQAQLRTETDEMRARMQRTFEQRLELARGDVVAGVLDTLDNLQRAVAAAENAPDQIAAFEALRDGVKATAEIFESQLKKMGLQPVVSEGEIFNPEVHDAVEIAPVSKDQDNVVLAELQRGYKFNERLLRPARVKVGRAD